MASTIAPLAEGEVHLVCASDDIADERLLAHYASLLATEDREHYEQLRFEHSRRQYLVTRALVRFVLSTYSGTPPERLVFAPNRWGKPAVVQPADVTLAFNVAHASGLVVCAVARADAVGVDVESPSATSEAVEIAQRFFSAAETDALRTLPPELLTDRFFDYWTLKEAYAKGRGLGLSLPFNRFTIDLTNPSAPSVSVAPGVDDGGQWGLRLLSVPTGHRLGAAVRLPPTGSAFDFKLHTVVPFASTLPGSVGPTADSHRVRLRAKPHSPRFRG
jgi:4'-phosphopantetheinyl transferase